mgnify:CR=1 FL=1
MGKAPEKINHWVTLVISVVLILGVGFKIQYDVESSETTNTKQDKSIEMLEKQLQQERQNNAVIQNELKHLKDEQMKQGDKLDKILERLP